MLRPRQAVILAGGRGTRLAPLTLDRPKPMIEFHGRPFLEYLIEQVREQGIEDILLLLGYRAQQIVDYFGDGRRWGIRIDYRVSDPDDETGTRLRLAADGIRDPFALLYCDNYWPGRFDAMAEAFDRPGVDAQIVVYRNRDGFTRDNIRVGEDRRVEVYDKTRQAEGLKGVEIAYLFARRSVLDLLPPDGNPSFEREVYPALIRRHALAAFETDHRYYSVSSHSRLAETDRFLARRPTVILDRDGVLNEKRPQAQYVRDWSEWGWLPGALAALAALASAGYQVAIVTNQAGISRGMMTEAQLEAIHGRMRTDAAAAGGRIDAVYYCPHDWNAGCDCRKPKPGMLFQAQRDLCLDLTRTPFVGDDERDGQAALAAGCPFIRVDEESSLLSATRKLLETHPVKETTCHNGS